MDQYQSISSYKSRTAGLQDAPHKSVQGWKRPKTLAPTLQHGANADIIQNLEKAAVGKVGHYDVEFKNALTYADARQTTHTNTESFRFRDVVDVMNPLHHIPFIGTAYRGLTGDELHPASQIIGGALYGGPVGAVTGTANAISKIQTGKDLGDHALEMAGLRSKTPKTNEINITRTPNTAYQNTIMAFADMKLDRQTLDDRHLIDLKNLKPKEALTTFRLSPLPDRHEI